LNYEELSQEEFDAVVTGELTHRALALEDIANGIICEYFIGPRNKENDFRRLILYRDGLTFQDKLEIIRGMLPLFGKSAEECGLKSILKEVEDFKSWRNTMAHGLDRTDPKEPLKLIVEVVTRSGKEKRIEITPNSHEKMLDDILSLEERFKKAREAVCDY